MMLTKNLKNLKNLHNLIIKNGDTSKLLSPKIIIADNFFARFKGLMFKKVLSEGEGLLLTRTKYIHTFWMLISIDILYLKSNKDNSYLVIDYERNKSPWRIGKINSNTTDVLELKQGSIDKNNITIGTILRFVV